MSPAISVSHNFHASVDSTIEARDFMLVMSAELTDHRTNNVIREAWYEEA